MIILGIHLATHDTGAAIIKDGKILAVVNEERLSRIKMDGNTPYRSIKEVMSLAGVTKKEIDVLAFSDMPLGLKRHFYFFWQQNQRVWYTKFKYLKSFLSKQSFSKSRLLKQTGVGSLKKSWQSSQAIKRIIKDFKSKGFLGKVEFVAHDLAHAASAYYTSGLPDSFVAIVEGASFTNTCSFWQPTKNGLKKVYSVPLPHSPGRYYEVVTLILGFHPKKHGGKITGLAGFGDPKKCYDQVKELLYIEDGKMKVSPKLYELHDQYFLGGKKIPAMFEGFSKQDVAAAFQKRLEEVVIEQLEILAKNYSIKHLALSGGVFANVKLNMEIAKLPLVEKIFIHPGMGDVGQALGAALQVYAQADKSFKPFHLKDVYFGPEYSNELIEASLKTAGIKYQKVADIAKQVGLLLSQNKVVGFFQGRMEYGPRALGNRSIMYPATDKKVNEWLNQQLNRTEFMPFAPVTLAERAGDCYKELEKCSYTAKFMTIAVPVTEYMKNNMPAAVHVDDTARPQLIDEQTNLLYYNAIKEYERLTGLPSVINTSFNMHEEPIVCLPQEAISAYQASNLDALAIGDYLVLK
ncbi:MAG: carbamoyltransferase C-terminal domain-containing protein [Candidatus Buchananbacteria bacterium]